VIKDINKNEQFWSGIESNKKDFLNALRAVAYGFSAKSKLKIPGFAEIEAGFVAKDMVDRSSALSSDPLLDKSIYYNSFERLSSIRLSRNKKIVVFIDDLDRCFPDKAIKLLESIKLVLSQRGFIFVLGVARQVIEGYLQHKYRVEYGLEKFEGHKYLDKIVQLSFPIPPHTQRINDFTKAIIKQLDDNSIHAINPIMHIIECACDSNPRSTVRFINNLLIDRAISISLYNHKPPGINLIGYFAITRAFQQRWSYIFDELLASEDLIEKVSSIQMRDKEIYFDHKGSPEDPEFGNDIISTIIGEKNLLKLILSDEGQNWLKDKELRNFAVDFLQTQRQEVEDDVDNRSKRIRVYELAIELNMKNSELLKVLSQLDIHVGSHMSVINPEFVDIIKRKVLKERSDNNINKLF